MPPHIDRGQRATGCACAIYSEISSPNPGYCHTGLSGGAESQGRLPMWSTQPRACGVPTSDIVASYASRGRGFRLFRRSFFQALTSKGTPSRADRAAELGHARREVRIPLFCGSETQDRATRGHTSGPAFSTRRRLSGVQGEKSTALLVDNGDGISIGSYTVFLGVEQKVMGRL